VPDSTGGAIVIWSDGRSASPGTYAQRLNASGSVQWAADGVLILERAGREEPQIIADGDGGAIFIWTDSVNENWRIYGQRIDGDGAIQWASEGVEICAATAISGIPTPQLLSDGYGGAIVTWCDYGSGSHGVRAQRVNPLGALLWAPEDHPVCTQWGQQPRITSDGSGGAIIAWGDYRCSSWWIYAQRVRASGEIVATLLKNYSVTPSGTGIRIDWFLSRLDEDARFSIERASAPDWTYGEIAGASIKMEGLSFSFTDETCRPGQSYKYRIDCEIKGRPTITLFETEIVTIPSLPAMLYQNHPNPFNPRTVIRFYLPEAQEVVLDIYDTAGKRVVRLEEGLRQSGYHEIAWNGLNSSGAHCSSGLYFYRLKVGKETMARKMVLLK
jgi:hypothetical protein